jgi:nucleoside phosphorylase
MKWICALLIEMAAAQNILNERYSPLPSRSHDNNNYIFGRIENHNIIIIYLSIGMTGTISATKIVTQMLSIFQRLKFKLIIGIGGGISSKENNIRLKNIVVSQPIGA